MSTREFERCSGGELEGEFVKIAIYADKSGTARHVARQLKDGRWVSKLGDIDDIEHDLVDVFDGTYGLACLFMRRSRKLEDP